jgi:hypothetical protein
MFPAIFAYTQAGIGAGRLDYPEMLAGLIYFLTGIFVI